MAEPTLHEFTAGDGYVWRYRRYTPDAAALAQVVFLHGIQSHGGWYEYSCERLRHWKKLCLPRGGVSGSRYYRG